MFFLYFPNMIKPKFTGGVLYEQESFFQKLGELKFNAPFDIA